MKHFFKVMFGISREVHRFETDPVEQYHFHLFFTWFWLAAMGVVFFVVPHQTGQEKVALIILEVSLWANFVSHFTAVGASIAGIYASHQEEVLSGHIVRGFFGRIKRKKILSLAFTNPNAEISEDDSAHWVEQLITPSPTETELGDFSALNSEPQLEEEIHI